MTVPADIEDIHRNEPIIRAGADPARASGAVLLLHGRGGRPEDMLDLGTNLGVDGFFMIAPRAAGNTWYPFSFTEDVRRNEPWLSSALSSVGACLEQIRSAGIPQEQTIILGFSQGACLALEYAVRNPARYGGVVALSGGLIDLARRDHRGDRTFAGTPVYIGCSTADPHIPVERVHAAAEACQGLGALVTMRLIPGSDHGITEEELDEVHALALSVARGPATAGRDHQ